MRKAVVELENDLAVGLLFFPRRSKRGRFVAKERRVGLRIDTNDDSFFFKRYENIPSKKINKFGGPFVGS